MKIAWFFVWLFRLVFFTVLLTPLIMWLVWVFTPKVKVGITIVDKTVADNNYDEHRSLFWVLNYEKWARPDNGKRYQVDRDYFGFYPEKNDQYTLKGLEGLSYNALDSIAEASRILYLTDTYGMYYNEWYTGSNLLERSALIYGGLSKQDAYLLQKMDKAGNTILTEFNCIGNPTSYELRKQFENQFRMQWSGWIGKYFASLDTIENKELPHWLINNYLEQYGHWPFKAAGIVLVHESDRLIILEDQQTLYATMPVIYTRKHVADSLSLPSARYYQYWFDIIHPSPATTEVLAYYHLPVNSQGDSLLKKHGLNAVFPAVLKRRSKLDEAQFYYFAGDFSDNPVNLKRSYFKGIPFFGEFYYDENDISDRLTFFWTYYRPLMQAILEKNQ
jgi:hypothetical protein